MAGAQGCCPNVRLLLCLFVATLTLAGCASLAGPPYCPAKPPVPPVTSGPGGPLYQKALAYDRFFQENLQPRPYGGVVSVVFNQDPLSDSRGELLGYDDPQDSTIWTGIYLASQAFRYAATADPAEKQEALRNARSAAQTLHLFLKVTGRPGLLARFAGPLAETKTYLFGSKCCEPPTPDAAGLCCAANNGCAQSPSDPTLFWLGGTTRDQYSGWFFGMGIAYRLIDDPELRQLIGQDMKEVVTALESQEWTILGPDKKPTTATASEIEPLMQAAWLLLAAEVSDDPACCQAYEKLVRDPLRLDFLLVEDDFDWTNRYLQYYGFNLSFLAFYNLIQLEPQEARRRAYLKSLEDHTYSEVKGTGNAFFDYIALAAGARTPKGTLESARRSLEHFPDPPNRWHHVVPPPREISDASIALYEIAKRLDSENPKILPQAKQPYPIVDWCRQDFLWQQTPYAICCGKVLADRQWTDYQRHCGHHQVSVSHPEKETLFTGVDYLIAYWMGRYHNFLRPES